MHSTWNCGKASVLGVESLREAENGEGGVEYVECGRKCYQNSEAVTYDINKSCALGCLWCCVCGWEGRTALVSNVGDAAN
jgi:hypothetical protein